MRWVTLVVVATLVASGCGADSDEAAPTATDPVDERIYARVPTGDCLRKLPVEAVETRRRAGDLDDAEAGPDLGNVENSATQGAIAVWFPDTEVHLAFGADVAEGQRLYDDWTLDEGIQMGNGILYRAANVAVVWLPSPSSAQRKHVDGCLSE